jgi:hypothetical protein
VCIIRTKPDVLLSEYLEYYLNSPLTREYDIIDTAVDEKLPEDEEVTEEDDDNGEK